VVQKTQVAHFRLCHSRAFFVRAYPNQKMEMLIDIAYVHKQNSELGVTLKSLFKH
jgi:hypothetical protein